MSSIQRREGVNGVEISYRPSGYGMGFRVSRAVVFLAGGLFAVSMATIVLSMAGLSSGILSVISIVASLGVVYFSYKNFTSGRKLIVIRPSKEILASGSAYPFSDVTGVSVEDAPQVKGLMDSVVRLTVKDKGVNITVPVSRNMAQEIAQEIKASFGKGFL